MITCLYIIYLLLLSVIIKALCALYSNKIKVLADATAHSGQALLIKCDIVPKSVERFITY
jgi:hypothetical protein